MKKGVEGLMGARHSPRAPADPIAILGIFIHDSGEKKYAVRPIYCASDFVHQTVQLCSKNRELTKILNVATSVMFLSTVAKYFI